MSCYHPLFFVPSSNRVDPETGEVIVQYSFSGDYVPEKLKLFPDGVKVPCGKCLGCKLDYSRRWADRLTLELDSYNGLGMFVTLTYNNDHIPQVFDDETDECLSYTLCKRDLQLFFKRLRKRFPDRVIRFYACGEYGPNTHRPHYHAIILGISLCDFSDKVKVGVNEFGQSYYSSEEFLKNWSISSRVKVDGVSKFKYDPIGFVCMSDVTYRTCAYVARYCAKKVYGSSVLPHWQAQEEFSLMSRVPGIGMPYLIEHPDVFNKSLVYLNDGEKSIEVYLPKYFTDYALIPRDGDPKEFIDFRKSRDKILSERKRFSQDKELLMLQNTDLSFVEEMEMMEEEKMNKCKILFNREEV